MSNKSYLWLLLACFYVHLSILWWELILYHLLSAVCITVLSFLHIFNSYSFMGHNYCYLYFSDEWNWSIEWLSIFPKHQGSWRITIMLLDCFIGCSWRKAVNSGLLKSDNSWKWNIDILGCFLLIILSLLL